MVKIWKVYLKDGTTEEVPNEVIGIYSSKNISNIKHIEAIWN